jgi:hypothetical protein
MSVDDAAGILVRVLKFAGRAIGGFLEYLNLREGYRALKEQFRGGRRKTKDSQG